MDLRHLVTFRKVAALGSITRAAAELNYAQSSVTGQIKSLEKSLGVQLFERLAGGVRPTPAGLRLLPYAERLTGLAEAARRAVGSAPDAVDPVGTLTIGATESLISYRLPPVLELFQRRFPDLRVEVRDGRCPDTLREVRRGTLDLGVVTATGTDHAGLRSAVTGTESVVLAVAPTHPLAAVEQPELEQVLRIPVLAPDSGCRCYRDRFEALVAEHGERTAPVRGFGNVESTKQGVAAGLGVGLLPASAVAREFAERSLVPLGWQPPIRLTTQLVWRRGGLPMAGRLLVDGAIALLAEDHILAVAA